MWLPSQRLWPLLPVLVLGRRKRSFDELPKSDEKNRIAMSLIFDSVKLNLRRPLKVHVLCTWQFWSKCSGPNAQPNFQPVTENVFPALPIVMVRSYISGRVAIRIISFPSNTICSYTSSDMTRTLCFLHKLAISSISSRWKTFPSGLLGLLNMMALVLLLTGPSWIGKFDQIGM